MFSLKHNQLKIAITILLVSVSTFIYAQQIYSLNDVLKIALETNYSIQVAKNDAEIARVNNYAGNAGMMPRINGTVLQDNQTANTDQKYANGTDKSGRNAQSNQFAANIELGWTIFDGFKMFASRNKLKELQEIGEMRFRFQSEFIFARVIRAYYDVVQNKQILKMNTESVKLSEERFQLAKDRYTSGKAAKNEMLNAQVDLNTDKSVMIRQANALKNNKALLLQTIGADITKEFDVADNIDVNPSLKFDSLRANALSQNSSILLAKKNARVSQLSIKEIESERMPNLQLYSGYNYSNSSSQSGFLQSNLSNGYHFGAGVSMNIFNGFNVNKRMQAAKIYLQSNDLVLKDTMSRVDLSIKQSYNTYLTSLELVKFEKENVEVATSNFELASEQYKIGVINSLELRTAQQNLLQSQSRYSSVQYEAKLAETDLIRISGGLLSIK